MLPAFVLSVGYFLISAKSSNDFGLFSKDFLTSSIFFDSANDESCLSETRVHRINKIVVVTNRNKGI